MTDPDTHACRYCDADGWRLAPGRRLPITPYVACDHQPAGTPSRPASPATRRAAMDHIRRVLAGGSP